MIYQLFNEFQKKKKFNDSSLLIFLFKKFIKINIKTPLSSLFLLITHFTQDTYDFLSEKIGTENFPQSLSNLSLNNHNIIYDMKQCLFIKIYVQVSG